MPSTATSRRQALRLLGGACLLPAMPALAGTRATSMLASAGMTADGQHNLVLLEPGTGRQRLIPLPGRAHGIASLPGGRLLAVARRPGRFAVLVDAASGYVEQTLASATGRHFYGHAAMSLDGRYLYTSENDYDAGRGVVGVRDAGDGWRQVAEFDSHGVGPHEIALAADGRSLIVANGGIQTHPEQGRRKLNLDSMAPNMARLALADGALLDRAALPPTLSRLSLRHIDVRDDGLVGVAGQYQGATRPGTPLLAIWRPGQGLAALPADDGLAPSFHGYCASVKFDASGRYLAVTAPRGALVAFWEMEPARYLGLISLPDGAGIAAAGAGRFLVSNGYGTLTTVAVDGDGFPAIVDRQRLPWRWDNHLTAV